ncbi:tctex1 domain-containing protein 2-like isoform X2 [Anoplophora glabripennis]|uniref:tctex1 domain-containing protein 2-like isoform X2 n=1 Tax=Anoplophora glabripennis TaxID=217634 RepID=UPI000874D1AE|nr:tctex1 domain-containing protein 2-like isoform X2 [Anoplophora glabripennis]
MEDDVDSLGPEDAVTPLDDSSVVELTKKSHDSIPPNAYQIKPSLQEKFKEMPVKEIIRNAVSITLTGKSYEPEHVKKWTISIANEVNERVKELQMKRYKHIVQVVIGEMKGAGVKSGVRCLWDSDVDGYTSEIFMNDTIFCLTTVFAIYLY